MGPGGFSTRAFFCRFCYPLTDPPFARIFTVSIPDPAALVMDESFLLGILPESFKKFTLRPKRVLVELEETRYLFAVVEDSVSVYWPSPDQA